MGRAEFARIICGGERCPEIVVPVEKVDTVRDGEDGAAKGLMSMSSSIT
jgi:hypothetical protein